ncbi:metallophosphoesterase family protein [Oleiharenicola lentus]|uniref:metallophosphoesterase family protein n=1 Tax=Oleiharenicola lentus TaxID=2508720 RepID=UPI003F66D8C4
MRILHVSDFHSNLKWFDWLSRAAVNYELVCIAGDLLDASQPHTIPQQIQRVSVALGRILTTVAICSGNHDLTDGADSSSARWIHKLRRRTVWVDGNSFKVGKQRFVCHSWLSPLPAAGEGAIWIIHSPPRGTATSRNRDTNFDHGDFEFRELCNSGRGPIIALCGHVHQPISWHAKLGRTLILNPGESADPQIPAHIVIDLKQRTATRHKSGRVPETIQFPECSLRQEILQRRTGSEIESLLGLTVSNQRAEGIHLTPAEIEETWRRLRQLAEYE